MTPFFPNPQSSTCPFVEQAEDQQHLKLFISPYQASPSLLSPAFFKTTQDERGNEFGDQLSQHDEKADNPISHGSCDHRVFSSSSLQSVAEDSNNGHKFSICEREDGDHPSKSHDGSSVQWMSSKVRLMQKVMNPNFPATDRPLRITQKFQNQQHEDSKINSNISNNTVRVCSDCNTTTTPLWRSGPRGPKTLCNACGIRQRKARRAMAEAAAAAANGLAVGTDVVSSMKSKVHNKEKKTRTSHVAQFKNKCKLANNSSHGERKLSFKDFALSLSNNSAFGVFPQDEAEAAILLMELSCGLVHT